MVVNDPTCFKGPTPSILDVILVTNPRRYISTLNVRCYVSDFHNIIGAATKRFAPEKKRELYTIEVTRILSSQTSVATCAPFHVMDIFDDIDDMAWYTSSLIKHVVDHHAPIKSKFVPSQSVPYTNFALRKARYQRNMARNKFKKYGKSYWEENRRLGNQVAKISKNSMRKYFEQRCSKQDKNFWKTISPFFSDKKSRNGNHIALSENNGIINDQHRVAEMFNDYFSTVAMGIGFDDSVISATDAINKLSSHPSVLKIQGNRNPEHSFSFQLVDTQQVSLALKR